MSQGSAGGGAAASSGGVAVTAAETEMTAVAAEEEQLGSAETEEHIQRILLAIDNFTRQVIHFCTVSLLIQRHDMDCLLQVSEMLDTGRALFRDLASDFEERLCS